MTKNHGLDPDANTSGIYGFPFDYYGLNLPGTPFGAINVGDKSLDEDSIVYAGSAPSQGDLFGFPYSCNSNREVYDSKEKKMVNSCKALYFEDRVRVINPSKDEFSDLGIKNRVFFDDILEPYELGRQSLPHLWLKINLVKKGQQGSFYTFNHSRKSNTPIETTAERTDPLKFLAVLPKIKNIKLKPLLSSGVVAPGLVTFSTFRTKDILKNRKEW